MSEGNASPQQLPPEEQTRANTYRLLGALLAQPPSEETISTLREIDIDEAEHAHAMGAAWKMLSLAAQRANVDNVDDEYHTLFIGIGRGELVPYGSWYLTGFLMEQPLAQLRQDLKRFGFARRSEVHEPEDHAAALCETMALVVESAPQISVHEQKQFFDQHIEPWMGKFFQDVQNAKSASFYSAVGCLGEQFLEIDKQYLDMLPH